MDCGVCLSGDYDRPEFYHDTIVKARKQYKCCECNRAIEPVSVKHCCWVYEKEITRQIDEENIDRPKAIKAVLDAAGVKYVD